MTLLFDKGLRSYNPRTKNRLLPRDADSDSHTIQDERGDRPAIYSILRSSTSNLRVELAGMMLPMA